MNLLVKLIKIMSLSFLTSLVGSMSYAAPSSSTNITKQTLTPMTQFVIVKSETPKTVADYGNEYTTSGLSNRTRTCRGIDLSTNKNSQQLIGVNQLGYSAPAPDLDVKTVRDVQNKGSMRFKPICLSANSATGCPTANRPYMAELTRIDTVELICAENLYKWQPVKGYP